MVIPYPAHRACRCKDAGDGIIDFRIGKATVILVFPTGKKYFAVREQRCRTARDVLRMSTEQGVVITPVRLNVPETGS